MSSATSKRVLVVNSGSSSLKYRLIDVTSEQTVTCGLIERIGEPRESSVGNGVESPPMNAHHTRDSTPLPTDLANLPFPEGSDVGSGLRVWRASMGGSPEPTSDTVAPEAAAELSPESTSEIGVPDHDAAFRVMLERIAAQGIDPSEGLVAVGHRVVHGGERFVEPTIVTDEVKAAIDELATLAPLHNPPNLAGIRAAETVFPGVPQVAVFDTAFHSTLSPTSRTYAIDSDLAAKHGIRRFGFHGISFEYVARESARMLGRPAEDLRLIILHLGNGASACAVRGGASVETSMGLTPLEGLVMGTRGGDIDPGVLIHLQRVGGLDSDALDSLLNHESGLLGLGGHNDIRNVQAAADAGDGRAALAIEVYCHRIRSYIGAYLAQLGSVDAIVFTAGVGEHNARVRALAVDGLGTLGISLDPEANTAASGRACVISAQGAPVTVLVVPTNEELEIARQSIAVAGVG